MKSEKEPEQKNKELKIIAKNTQSSEANSLLEKENSVLKNQLNQALELTKEIKELNIEKRKLNKLALESNQKVIELQNLLQISQKKNKGITKKLQELEEENAKYKIKEKEMGSKISELNQSNEQTYQSSTLLEQAQAMFFENISKLTNTNVRSFNQVIDLFKQIKPTESNEKIKKKNAKLIKNNSSLKKQNEILLSQLKEMRKTNEQISQEMEIIQFQQTNEINEKYQSLTKEFNSLQASYNSLKKDRNKEFNDFKKQIETKNAKIKELQQTISNIESAEMQKLLQQVSEINVENKEINEKNNELKKQNAQFHSQISKLNSNIKQLKKQKQNLMKLNQMQTEKLKKTETKISEMNLQKDELDKSIIEYKEEKDKLKSQINNNYEIFQREKEELQFKNKKLNEALNEIQQQMEKQKLEIDEITSSRLTILKATLNMNSILSLYESNFKAELEKKKKIEAKYEKLSLKLNSSFLVPFSIFEYIKDNFIPQLDKKDSEKLQTIIQNPIISPTEKIQALFNELYLIFKSIQNNNSTKFKNLSMLNSSIIKSLQEIIKNGDDNPFIVDFLAAKEEEIKSFIKKEMNEINPFESLFQGTYEQRKNAIEKIRMEGFDNETTFDLFCFQSLSNILLFQNIMKLNDQLKEHKICKKVFNDIFGTDNITQILKEIKTLIKEYQQIKSSSRDSQKLERKLKEKESLIQKLRSNFKVIVHDTSILQKQLETKLQEIESLHSSHSQLEEEITELQRKHFEESNNLEETIKNKDFEIHELKMKLQQNISSNEIRVDNLLKQNSKLKNEFEIKLKKWKQIESLLNQKRKNQEHQFIAKLKAKDAKNQENIQRMNNEQNNMKSQYEKTIDQMKNQLKDSNILCEKLSESLQKSEEKVQYFTKKISKLKEAKQSIEEQIDTLNEQIVNESQQSVSMEAQHQNKISSLKGEYEKKLQDIYMMILNEFGEFDQFVSEDLDENAFTNIIHHIASKYKETKNL